MTNNVSALKERPNLSSSIPNSIKQLTLSLDDDHPTGEVQRLTCHILGECRKHGTGKIVLLWNTLYRNDKKTSFTYIELNSKGKGTH
jgi:hypothetical protein